MKNYVYEYLGYTRVLSKCRVYIRSTPSSTWIGFENLGFGTSVTNASELLASEIIKKEHLDPRSCRFFEFYPEYEGNVDEVFYHWDGLEASQASWKHYCSAEDNPFYE
jgi:hypothetical protein